MRDVPQSVRRQLRDLSLGRLGDENEPASWGVWSWPFRDGSTWATIAQIELPSHDLAPPQRHAVAWAAFTLESDVLPVIGLYVHQSYRGEGLGSQLVRQLLHDMKDLGRLHQGDVVYASTWRYKRYPDLLAEVGARCVAWS